MTPAPSTPCRRALRLAVDRLASCALAVGLTACSPALDWREFTPEGSGIQVAFPCRPDREARAVSLAGDSVTIERLLCSVDGTTFAVSFFDVTDAARVVPLLDAWRSITLDNLRGTASAPRPLAVRGMTANLGAGSWDVDARRPDGTALHARFGFFVHGLRVYQAAVMSSTQSSRAAPQTFFDALRFPA